MDVIAMLLERRQVHAVQTSDNIVSIALHSGASPVTGEELHGMIMDICSKDGRIRRSTVAMFCPPSRAAGCGRQGRGLLTLATPFFGN